MRRHPAAGALDVTHVVVLGLMGSGKTTIGRKVAGRLGRPFVDGDRRLAARAGRTAAEIVETDGIDALHRAEAALLLDALAAAEPSVIAPAASTVEDPACRAALATHAVVVWLSVPAQLLAERAVRKRHRPLVGSADDVALFERQLATREPLALPLAALVIDETSVSEDEAADRIVRLVDSGTAAPPSPPP